MNMFKSNGGFTLVELIVVIAILAILAGVAVPAYSGYISKANDAADTTALAAVKTAAQGAMAKTGSVSAIDVNVDATTKEITDISCTVNGASVELYDADGAEGGKEEWNADFMIYMNSTMIKLKGSFTGGAVWSTTDGWKVG